MQPNRRTVFAALAAMPLVRGTRELRCFRIFGRDEMEV